MLPCYGLCLRDVLMAGGAGKAPPQAQPDPHARLSHAARISRRQQPCDGRCVASHAVDGWRAAVQAARRGRQPLAPAHAVRHGGGRAVAPAAHALGRALPGERAHAGQH